MTFNNAENSLSLAYDIRKITNEVTKAKAVARAVELEDTLHKLHKENKEIKLQLTLLKSRVR